MVREAVGFDSSTPDAAVRGIRTGVNGRLFDALHRHRHFLLRAENGIIRDVAEPFIEARREIVQRLSTVAASLGALENMSRVQPSRLRELKRTAQTLIAEAEMISERTFAGKLRDLGEREAEFQGRLLRREVPEEVRIDPELPTRSVSVAVEAPTAGRRWPDRHRANVARAATDTARQIEGVAALQETASVAIQRVTATIEQAAISAVAMLGRTEVQAVANRVARAMYVRNGEAVRELLRVETLDDRTCLICASIDGTTVKPDTSESDLAPFHPGCRGFTVPVLKSIEEMGLEAVDLKPKVRDALDGQVPGSVTYRDWFQTQSEAFQRQVLGPSRFRRFKSGELEIKDFVRDLQILPLDSLPEESLGFSGN